MDTNHSPIISPLTMRESARGITLTSIYDEMLARRELSVMGNIETPMAHDLCQQIRLLDATDPSRPITIFVASAGGSVRSGLAIYDAMRLASCPIRTVCLEFAASMGAVIFMGGDDRRMAPHAELMIHDPLIPQGAGGSALRCRKPAGVSCRPARPSRKSSRTAAASRPSASSPSHWRHLPFARARRRARLCHEILSTTKEVAHV
ncbi:MAG: ATP-dependent Clp protease proteolytic subunit [Collinsella sp.]